MSKTKSFDMKKTLLFFGLAASSMALVQAQNISVPDANFKAYLVGNNSINTNMDTEIQLSEAQAYTGYISCGSLNISDLTGIEAFANITGIECYSNQLTALDLSNNLALTSVIASHNQITTLDISNNSSVGVLFIQNNQLTSLNMANGNNVNFTNINTTSNPNLACIQIDDSDTTGYGWSGNPNKVFDTGVGFSDNCSLTSKIDEKKANVILNVYPNPTNAIINIELNREETIEVLNLLGEIILTTSLTKSHHSIDLSTLKSGIYFIRSSSGDQIKFIKN